MAGQGRRVGSSWALGATVAVAVLGLVMVGMGIAGALRGEIGGYLFAAIGAFLAYDGTYATGFELEVDGDRIRWRALLRQREFSRSEVAEMCKPYIGRGYYLIALRDGTSFRIMRSRALDAWLRTG